MWACMCVNKKGPYSAHYYPAPTSVWTKAPNHPLPKTLPFSVQESSFNRSFSKALRLG